MTEPNAVKQQQKPLTLIGVHRSPKGYALRDFLHRSNIPFIWAELTSDAEAHDTAQVSGLSDPRLPICIFPDGERMESPTIRQVVEKLGWFKTPSRTEYDLAILGAGPAGLSAAVYGASEGLKTVVIERSVSEVRPAPRPASRTTSAFLRESAAMNSPPGHANRRVGSAPKSFCCVPV